MSFPLAEECFVVKPSYLSQTWGTGNGGNILPFLVPFQDLAGCRRALLVNTAVLQDLPHVVLCIYHIWYVKRCRAEAA
jgi:hypothetical protein